MIEVWRRWRESGIAVLIAVFAIQSFNSCFSLNDEGLALLRFKERLVSDPFEALSDWNDAVGVSNPCSWSGVKCINGNVAILNLKDLCLGGTLGTDLRSLVHIKLIILRNNSFYGVIPEMFQELKELEVLDLGYNNFSSSVSSYLGNNMPLPKGVVLLDNNNDLFSCISPELNKLKLVSEALPISSQRNINQAGDLARRGLIGNPGDDLPIITFPFPDAPPPPPPPPPPTESSSPSPSPTPSPAPAPLPESYFPASPTPSSPPPFQLVPSLSPSLSNIPSVAAKSSSANHRRTIVLSLGIGVPVLFCSLMICLFFCQGKKVAAMRPWATGLSGQLQRALVTGVPMLKRSELEAACEDFSNVIASSPYGTIYKGTLSSGVEIAVTSVAVASAKDWSNSLEAQFRNKIDLLSKVNHKNFVNLLGYCKEAEPFSRMLVFEYAPNGTVFEHLHIKEAEHLDWGTRMRITMGTAYCLDHMHNLSPPVAHKTLNSSSINLTEDYSAKLSDFIFSNDAAAPQPQPTLESNVYSFGVLLFELVTGKIPYSVERGNPDDWASHYLRGQRPLREMVDPTLRSFDVEQMERISEVIVGCVRADPKQRPKMGDVAARLREIIRIGPDGAVPKISPLWWAELEILSTEGS